MTTKNQSINELSRDEIAELTTDLAFQALTQNKPLFLLRGLKKEDMEALYAQGYYFYSQAKYKEALPLFRALTFYNSLDKRGWMGAGGCYEMLKQYEQALSCYSFAAIFSTKDDPTPSLHAFDCYIVLKNYPKALACLEAVILLSSNNPEHAALKKRAEVLKESLQKTITESQKSSTPSSL